MSPPQPDALARRLQLLLARSSLLRAELGLHAAELQRPLALADGVRDGWHWLRTHPQWPAGAVVVLALLRPRRALRWGLRLWAAWGVVRRLQTQLRG